MAKFWTKQFGYRLFGNFGLTFLAPFTGANLLSVEFLDTIYLALISSSIVTGLIFFRRVEKFGNTSKSS